MADFATDQSAELIGDFIWDAITTAQHQSPRTMQTREGRILGMSQLGGCREYIRATIGGEPMDDVDEMRLKWAAYIGTAVGDKIEADVKRMLPGSVTQKRVTLFMQVGDQQISVSGSTDILFPDSLAPGLPPAVVDLKSRDGLADVKREGPPFKEKVQIAGYLIASIDEGVLPAEAIGLLLYYDRSGRDKGRHVWAINREQALLILDAASQRLEEVAASLATGRHAPRDEPESWCFHVGCPFYNSCWSGYQPSGAIENERDLDAIRRYTEARRDSKDATSRMRAASGDLDGVTGVTPDGTTLTWVLQQNGSTRIDLREPK